MRLLLLTTSFLFLLGCQPKALPSSEVVTLPPGMEALAIGDSIDLGYGFVYTRISETKAIRQKPVVQPLHKCKNCFNTDNSDNSKDKSKTKDNSDTTIKDKSDQSQLKKAEIDNSVNKGEDYGTWIKKLGTKLLLFLGVAFGLFLLVKSEFWKLFFIVLIAGTLSSCASSCPAYKPMQKPMQKPMYKPTFYKDDGRQKNKYSVAAKSAADKMDKEFYLSILKLTN